MLLTDIATPPAAKSDPILTAAHASLAKGDYAAALQVVLPFVETPPIDAAHLDIALTCYWHLGDTGTALALLELAIRLSPESPMVWGKLGAMLLSMGEKDGAAAAFEQTLQLQPRSVTALGALNLITRFGRDSHRARLLRELAKAKGTSPRDRATAWNALGQIEEGAGRYSAAFRCFEKSNAAEPAPFRHKAFEALVDQQEAVFQPAEPLVAADAPRCIFVVGLPRSGTTLVDSILKRHPLVRSTGEGTQLPTVLAALRKRFPGDGTPWAWLNAAGTEDLRRAQTDFYRGITPPEGLERPYVVNKLPLSAFDLGFAQRLLPGARFVFMSRHPLDVGLSNFRTNFHETNAFSKTLPGIARMTRALYRSLDDYIPKLGDTLRVQSYSALVADPEPQIRALVAHVGLPWDDACLTPEEGEGAVHTASVLQVREAINLKGLDKWRRYEDQLAPLVTALDPDWLAQWAARDAAWGAA